MTSPQSQPAVEPGAAEHDDEDEHDGDDEGDEEAAGHVHCPTGGGQGEGEIDGWFVGERTRGLRRLGNVADARYAQRPLRLWCRHP